MQKLGANKLALASLTSEALWKKSGRFTGDNPEMFRLEGTGYLLSPTHEEEITNLVASTVTSYRDLPLRLYQISRKYRNELRPRQGLLRTREFLMKDLYTFDVQPDQALQTYQEVKQAYMDFFNELRLPYLVAEADSGAMGGNLSHEFHFATTAGEDNVISCDSCSFAVNEELAAGRIEKTEGTWGSCPMCKIGQLKEQRAVELGHTFYLGTRYSAPLNACVDLPHGLDSAETEQETATKEVKRVALSMGCHGIGVSRLIGAVASVLHDGEGLNWPRVIAPCDVVIVPAIRKASPHQEEVYDMLCDVMVGGYPIDPIIDDRIHELGWKLNDADLIGYPVIVVLGRSWKELGKVEVQCRRLQVREEVHKNDLPRFVGQLLLKL